jgi:unsaturated rhamnogalacturonyl hydrolase
MQHITYLEENHNQLWDDTPMMTVLPLAKIGTLLHRPHYVDEAKRQFLLHIQYLYDAPTGLFFHGWQFDDENKDARSGGSLGHHFARARWARGNSWLTIAIPDFLELLDNTSGGGPDDGFKVYLVNVLEAQCRALRRLQTSAGTSRTLLDMSEEEGSYQEASATAGFAYGLLKSIRKRYISKKEYLDIATKAGKLFFGASIRMESWWMSARNSHGARFEALCRYRVHEHAVWSSNGHHGDGGVSPSVHLM